MSEGRLQPGRARQQKNVSPSPFHTHALLSQLLPKFHHFPKLQSAHVSTEIGA